MYQIVRRVTNVSYELDQPVSLASVHPIFHMSMMKKYMDDPSFKVPVENIGISNLLSYEEVPIEILDRKVRRLRTKYVSLVKVLLRN